MAQHISWSQGRSTSLLISKSILQTSTLVWTVTDTKEGNTSYTIVNPHNFKLIFTQE